MVRCVEQIEPGIHILADVIAEQLSDAQRSSGSKSGVLNRRSSLCDLSWTLSKYIFLDLFKVFMMTNGALAGIMSFGGMLNRSCEAGSMPGRWSKC